MSDKKKVVIKKAAGVGAAATIGAAHAVKAGVKQQDLQPRKFFVSGPGMKSTPVMALNLADAAKQGAELAKCKMEDVRVVQTSSPAPAGAKKTAIVKKPEPKKAPVVVESAPVELNEAAKAAARGVAAELAAKGKKVHDAKARVAIKSKIHHAVLLPNAKIEARIALLESGKEPFTILRSDKNWPWLPVMDKDETTVIGVAERDGKNIACKLAPVDCWLTASEVKDLAAAKALLATVEGVWGYDDKGGVLVAYRVAA